MLETCFGTKTALFLSKVKAAMFLLTVALIMQVRHSFPSALEQSTSRALFLIPAIANTASVQYTYDKGNLSSVQRTNNGKSQTYDFTHDDFGNMLTAKVGSRTLTTNVYNNSFDQLVQQTYGNGAVVSYTMISWGGRKRLPTMMAGSITEPLSVTSQNAITGKNANKKASATNRNINLRNERYRIWVQRKQGMLLGIL